jgi:hypothetical protein
LQKTHGANSPKTWMKSGLGWLVFVGFNGIESNVSNLYLITRAVLAWHIERGSGERCNYLLILGLLSRGRVMAIIKGDNFTSHLLEEMPHTVRPNYRNSE